MYPPHYCFKCFFTTAGQRVVGWWQWGKKVTRISNTEIFFSVNKSCVFCSQMCSLHPGGEREKQDDSKAAIIMTCDVWLATVSVVYVCFLFDMLFSLRESCGFCWRNTCNVHWSERQYSELACEVVMRMWMRREHLNLSLSKRKQNRKQCFGCGY